MRMSSIAALTCKFFVCAASSNAIRVHPASSRPSVAWDTYSPFRWFGFEGPSSLGIANRQNAFAIDVSIGSKTTSAGDEGAGSASQRTLANERTPTARLIDAQTRLGRRVLSMAAAISAAKLPAALSTLTERK